jgi:hypothetical protein
VRGPDRVTGRPGHRFFTVINLDRRLDLIDGTRERVLHDEEVVIDRRTVPKERVRTDTDVLADEQQSCQTAGVPLRP